MYAERDLSMDEAKRTGGESEQPRSALFPVHDDVLRLEHERARLAMAIDQASESIVITEPDASIIYVNPAFERVTGYTSAEMLSRNPRVLQSGMQSAAFYEAMWATLNRGETWRGMFVNRARDGTLFEEEAVISPVFDSGSRLINYVAVKRDVTRESQAEKALRQSEADRKRAEDDLRHSEARYRAVLEQSPIPIAAYRAGRGVFANAAHMRMFGYARLAELANLDIEDMVAPESRAIVHDRVRERSLGLTAETEAETEFEFVGRRRDGSTFPALARTAPIELPDGPATLVFHTDLTEARRTSDALRASEEKFAKAFQSAPMLMSLTDLETGTCLEVNDEQVRVSGFSRAEVLGRTGAETGWMSDESRTQIADQVSTMGRVTQVEVDCRAKDGRKFIGLVSGEVVTILGRECLLAVTVDITERRRAEKERSRLQLELAQAQKMEAIGRLAGGIAHDFNNLLTAIGGYARILETDLASGSADPSDASEIRHAADRAAALTAKLLAFAGRHDSQTVPIDVAALISQILPMLRRIVPERIEIATELPSGPPVLVDPNDFDRVIVNLIVNAADSISAIGRIMIETSAVDHDEAFALSHLNSRPGPHVRLTVSDTGSGMDETTRGRLFEPFFTTKPIGQGTGLGLSTIYGVVERMRGTIQVSSTPGIGTTFEIDLPASEPAGGLAAAATEPPEARGTERILIVEDEATVLRFASEALLRLGYRVITADGPEAAVLVPAADYDILVTDVVMPGMDGTELARKLRLTRPDLPVLLVSGYAHGTLSNDMLRKPRTAILPKPYTAAELANSARKLLDQNTGP